MLRINPSSSAAQAKSYYKQGLTMENYYAQEVVGNWQGRGAALLGLTGPVDQASFHALADNIHPQTGERLTQRTRQKRIVGYDFNFHVPKSVSIVHGFSGDERIVTALREAVAYTMGKIEQGMETRVRKGGRMENRRTGNMVWAEYIHTTARPVDGIPDPHLHIHNYVFNATYDQEERRWKAGKFRNLVKDAPLYQAIFRARLRKLIGELGYDIRQDNSSNWEIAGISRALVERFSSRTHQIETEAKRRGLTTGREKDELGRLTREKKRRDLGLAKLRGFWCDRVTTEELTAIRNIARRALAAPDEAASNHSSIHSIKSLAEEALAYAIKHEFERQAVVDRNHLLATALSYAREELSAADLLTTFSAFKDRKQVIVRKRNDRILVSTPQALAEERFILSFIRDGKGTCRPLNGGVFSFRKVDGNPLSGEQKRAVTHILNSRDRLIYVRGRAGVGKTTLMKEAARGIEAGGRQVFVFAPSAAASRGTLKREGFADADTVAMLLSSPAIQQKVKKGVIWVDEAGLLSNEDLIGVFQLAERQKARIVLSGDSRQYGPVKRGSPLKLIDRFAGIESAELKGIQRQKPPRYRKAVELISEGKIKAGFNDLAPDVVQTKSPQKRYELLAEQYLSSIKAGESTIIVAPTNDEGYMVTQHVRQCLREEGRLHEKSRQVLCLRKQHLTEAEKGNARSYAEGQIIQFYRPAKKIKAGERLEVCRVTDKQVLVQKPNRTKVALPLDEKNSKKFSVFEKSEIALGVGDRIRITQNSRSKPKRGIFGIRKSGKLQNGNIYTVKSISGKGEVRLSNGMLLSKDFGHLDYGYVMTSYGSQSASADRCLLAQHSRSGGTGREQFYVSVSRGRQSVTIYTDVVALLRERVQESQAQMTATEMLERARRLYRRQQMVQSANKSSAIQQQAIPQQNKAKRMVA
jgi:conjugative relaxase-like TrwC/TraI family protein